MIAGVGVWGGGMVWRGGWNEVVKVGGVWWWGILEVGCTFPTMWFCQDFGLGFVP